MPHACASKGRGSHQEFGCTPVVLVGALLIQLITAVSPASKRCRSPHPKPIPQILADQDKDASANKPHLPGHLSRAALETHHECNHSG